MVTLYPEAGGKQRTAANKGRSEHGYFIVEDRRSGAVWNSFPDPSAWPEETSQGQWRTIMRSPFILEYIDPKLKNDKPRMTNFIGATRKSRETDGGFELTYRGAANQRSDGRRPVHLFEYRDEIFLHHTRHRTGMTQRDIRFSQADI
ncbi:hypothetical protein [Paenibacillus alkalitolerans]|uniref:hypothetical protein n=1 Tax=Paenibacillus alkalitolerans TaxID=2799335 RepID=UPI0018F3C99D|nr:hypothetical protein [Paenibacillus alkalitolerans]